MKKQRDGAESWSCPRGMQAWIFTVSQSLYRASAFSVRFESHFHPVSLCVSVAEPTTPNTRRAHNLAILTSQNVFRKEEK